MLIRATLELEPAWLCLLSPPEMLEGAVITSRTTASPDVWYFPVHSTVGSALQPSCWVLQDSAFPCPLQGLELDDPSSPFQHKLFHVLMHPGREVQQDFLLCRRCWSHKEMRAESWMWRSEFWFEQQRSKQASSSDPHPQLRNLHPHHITVSIPLQKHQIQRDKLGNNIPAAAPEVLSYISCQHLLFSALTPTTVTVLLLLRETPKSTDWASRPSVLFLALSMPVGWP